MPAVPPPPPPPPPLPPVARGVRGGGRAPPPPAPRPPAPPPPHARGCTCTIYRGVPPSRTFSSHRRIRSEASTTMGEAGERSVTLRNLR